MGCKKHLSDLSSYQGVCASCLRQRLFPILAVQSDTHPQPSIFPHSVSPPHVTKSNAQNRLFHSTPQLAPVQNHHTKRERNRFSLFRSKKKADATSSPLPSWISGLFSSTEKNPRRRKGPNRGRGMSPATASDSDREDECGGGGSVGRRGGGGRRLGSGDVAGFAFGIRPLVRARPKPGKSKSMPKEEPIATAKPRLAPTASFCKNKSRKIADFGRLHRVY